MINYIIQSLHTSLEAKSSLTFVEQVFKRWAEEVHHHNIIVILSSKMIYRTKTMTIGQFSIYFVLMAQLWAPRAMSFKFHSHLIEQSRQENESKTSHLFTVQPDSHVYFTETPPTNPLRYPIFSVYQRCSHFSCMGNGRFAENSMLQN